MSELRRKQIERTEETKHILKEAFCKIYAQKPLDKISITELCRIAGFNRSTFYQYYLNLDDILLEIENETLEYIANSRSTFHTSDSNFVTELMAMYEQQKVYMDAMLGPNGTPRFINNLIKVKTEHISDFEVDKNDPHYPYLIEFRYNGVLSLLRLWMRRNRDLSFEDFVVLVKELYRI